MDFSNQRILVCGLGRSGQSAVRLLLAGGASVCAVDACTSPSLKEFQARYSATDCQVVLAVSESADAAPILETYTSCLVSPGIPDKHPWLKSMRSRGISCVSELELGWKALQAKRAIPTLAITGSLGKTSVAMFCHHALQKSGRSSALAGNIGLPVCEVAREVRDLDVLVLEVSSFQLESISEFAPTVGILLNLVPNHLDRHPSMECYRDLKLGMFRNMDSDALGIVPEAFGAAVTGPRQLRIGIELQYRPGRILVGERALNIQDSWFDNPIYGLNAAAAAGALLELGCAAEKIEEAFADFTAPPHRMAFAGEIEGVRYINDSKSTCFAATEGALKMMGKSGIRLILGGKLKEKHFQQVADLLEEACTEVYLIGEGSAELFSSFSRKVSCRMCGTLEAAMIQIREDAESGDTVLLSPGCSSFDQFGSFEERGQLFEELVAAQMKTL